MVEFLYYYGIFALSLSLAVLLTVIMPVCRKVKKLDVSSVYKKHPITSLVVMWLYVLIGAPFFVKLLISDEYHEQFSQELLDSMLDKDK